ncbi:hypothetical protein [Polaribacter sp. NJDZ03]|uniref:hypothetical protein n=1 Tax=Polaribacter sp. NJDZ03 TaxID=2855841 RepID=UPI001C4A56C8|nr:hypothetical protein [Polaribacter sp. NJDZ03]
MKTIEFTRKLFYNLVWSKSISAISKNYRISTSDVRKICKHFNIPLPLNGHWQKIKYNKAIIIIDLPENEKVVQEKIKLVKRNEGEKDIPFLTSPFNKRVFELKNNLTYSFNVPLTLKNPHPLILKAKKGLEDLDKLTKSNYEIERKVFNEILPIHTDLKLRNRALRIMNVIVSYIYKQNHSIVFEYGNCCVEMFGQKTEFYLRQKYNRIRTTDEKGWSNQSFIKTSNLEFRAGPSFNHKSWIDKENKKLEEYIPNIIAWIEQDCKYWHDLRKKQAEQERINEIERLKEEERLLLIKKEEVRIQNLIIHSEKWKKATILRNYINAAIEKDKSNNTFDEQKKAWVKWATDIANSIDPLTSN